MAWGQVSTPCLAHRANCWLPLLLYLGKLSEVISQEAMRMAGAEQVTRQCGPVTLGTSLSSSGAARCKRKVARPDGVHSPFTLEQLVPHQLLIGCVLGPRCWAGQEKPAGFLAAPWQRPAGKQPPCPSTDAGGTCPPPRYHTIQPEKGRNF